jgi:hypothetical protein
MAAKSERKFWVLLTLTVIPLTDFVGANWFYLRNARGGLGKVGLCALLLLLLLCFLLLPNPGLAVSVELQFFGLFVSATIIIWWIVDIFLVALRKRL